jgi:hypothetical protein
MGDPPRNRPLTTLRLTPPPGTPATRRTHNPASAGCCRSFAKRACPGKSFADPVPGIARRLRVRVLMPASMPRRGHELGRVRALPCGDQFMSTGKAGLQNPLGPRQYRQYKVRTAGELGDRKRSPGAQMQVAPHHLNHDMSRKAPAGGNWGRSRRQTHRLHVRKMLLTWSPLTESNRRPSPYHSGKANRHHSPPGPELALAGRRSYGDRVEIQLTSYRPRNGFGFQHHVCLASLEDGPCQASLEFGLHRAPATSQGQRSPLDHYVGIPAGDRRGLSAVKDTGRSSDAWSLAILGR